MTAAWKEVRIHRRTLPLGDLPLGDDAEIVQTIEHYPDTWAIASSGEWGPRGWEVVSQIVEEDDTSHAQRGLAKDLREAKQLADRHVDELRKTWASENGADW